MSIWDTKMVDILGGLFSNTPNEELKVRGAMGYVPSSSTNVGNVAEASPAPKSEPAPNVSYGNPVGYQVSYFAPPEEADSFAYATTPASEPAPTYSTPTNVAPSYSAPAYSEPAPIAPQDIDPLIANGGVITQAQHDEWASNPDNLLASHEMMIANAKNEYALAQKHGNVAGMERAAEKARLAREAAKADGTYDRLLSSLKEPTSGSYADFLAEREAQEQNAIKNATVQANSQPITAGEGQYKFVLPSAVELLNRGRGNYLPFADALTKDIKGRVSAVEAPQPTTTSDNQYSFKLDPITMQAIMNSGKKQASNNEYSFNAPTKEEVTNMLMRKR